jgi:uncharacterized protein
MRAPVRGSCIAGPPVPFGDVFSTHNRCCLLWVLVSVFSFYLSAQPCLLAAPPRQAAHPLASILELKSEAEAGDTAAQLQLSELVLSTDPSTASFRVALAWVRSAADDNNSRAEFVLGYLYDHGRGVPQDYAKAAKYYQVATLQGHRIAPNNLAALYYRGLGVPRDDRKAVELLLLSADRGDPTGRYNLGAAYVLGLGTHRNPAEAARWFRAAAQQGNAKAQRELGVLYFKGETVAVDFAQGARWITLAAQQGDPAAETDLGILYEAGRGVALDYIAAFNWYSKAAAAGERAAPTRLKRLSQVMTRDQLERAKAVFAAESASDPTRTTDSVASAAPTFLPEP